MSRFDQSLSVILPAFDEAPCIEAVVADVATAVGAMFREFEVLVVDDGSRDGTAAMLEQLTKRFPRVRVLTHATNRGYGQALRTGFAAARGDVVFFTDADGQFDVRQLSGAVPLLAECDAVLGYRRVPRYRFVRRCLSRIYNVLVRALFRVRVRDVDASFKLFRRSVIETMRLRTDDFFIDTEIVAELSAMGARTIEYPVDHLPRVAGSTTVRASHIPRTLWTVAKMFCRERQSLPLAKVRDVSDEIPMQRVEVDLPKAESHR